mmetsp:Transcript_40593/g.96439  ORF Transcript_40593/g.96439 Transcript_40593/m.96439 type:complete len:302 (+) Transcript_40593:547-1452(+)
MRMETQICRAERRKKGREQRSGRERRSRRGRWTAECHRPDRLCHNALNIVAFAEAELPPNVLEGDPRVGEVDAPEPCPDHVVPQADDQVDSLVLAEHLVKLLRDGTEERQVADADGLGELEVRVQRLCHPLLAEVGPLGHVAKQQPHHNQPLVHRCAEALGNPGSLSGGLLEALLGLGVLELDGTDAPDVVEVAGKLLRAAGGVRLLCLGPQLLRLIVEIEVQIVAQQQVEEGLGPDVVVAERGRPVQRQEGAADLLELTGALVCPRVVVIHPRGDHVEGAPVEGSDAAHSCRRQVSRLGE